MYKKSSWLEHAYCRLLWKQTGYYVKAQTKDGLCDLVPFELFKKRKKKNNKKQMQILPNRARTGKYIKMSGLTQLTKEFSEVNKLRNALISLSFERQEEIW